MPYRFVHAADIHLDSPLKSLALRDVELAEMIGNATRQAFVTIIELCLAEQVDALLLAGDLYDGDQTSMKTARFLADQLARLQAAGISVFIIRGNHDALSRITKELTLPDTVRIFGGRAEIVPAVPRDAAFDVAIHGISFAQPTLRESLLPKYKPPVPGAVNVGLMHTSLDGTLGHDEYAPCSVTDLDAAGFDYWALGHIHKRMEHRGRAVVVMPGMPQGRDINESGPKSVSLVTIADDRSVHVQERVTSLAQFERVPIDLTGIEEWPGMVRALDAGLRQKRAGVTCEHMVARPIFTGATKLAWSLRRDADLLLEEARRRASLLGRNWIETVEIRCSVPGEAGTGPAGALTELHALMDRDILASESLRLDAAAIAEELLPQLPPECRALLGETPEQFGDALTALVRDGAEDVLARLHAKHEPGDDQFQ